MHFKSSNLRAVCHFWSLMYVRCFPPLFRLPLPSVPLSSPSLAAAQLLFSPLSCTSSNFRYPPGNAWSLKVILAPLKGATTHYSNFAMRLEGVNPQLFSHASVLPFAMSTRCTERRRRQVCILPDSTASSL